jgi:hypothetical protein
MTFFSLKADVKVPSKSNKQKNFETNLIFVDILKATDEKSRIRILNRIRNSVVRPCGSGSVLSCHGSTTLIETLSIQSGSFYIDSYPGGSSKGWPGEAEEQAKQLWLKINITSCT